MPLLPFANPPGDTNVTRTAASLIVAASDSIDTTRADYVCDGTADEVQINLAIVAATATGGTVFLLEGTYTIAADIAMTTNISLVEKNLPHIPSIAVREGRGVCGK